MDIVEHYIKNSSLVEIPTDFKQLLNEASPLQHGDLFSASKWKEGEKEKTGIRKDHFIDIIDAALGPKKFKPLDVNHTPITITDPEGLWPGEKGMKKQLQNATQPKHIEDWKGSPAKDDATGTYTGKFAWLTGVMFKDFAKDLNGFSNNWKGLVAQTGGKSPTGADWEHLITHEWNRIKKQRPHTEASDHAKQFASSYFTAAAKVVAEIDKPSGSLRMEQFGGGKRKSNLTKFWQQWGASDGTPKADMLLGKWSISLKKSGGSQLMSAGKGETLATFHAALDWWQGDKGKGYIKKLIKDVENRFDKVATHHSKSELARLAKLPEDEWPEEDKAAIEKFVDVEAWHKEITAEIKEKLDPTQFPEFINYFVYEAMSGQKKFGETKPQARASVCCEFKDGPDAGVAHWVNLTSSGKIDGFTDPPKISGDVKNIAKSANMYVSWKSSKGSPYSTWRIGLKKIAGLHEDRTHDRIPSIKTILKTVILEDELVKKVNKKLLSENIQLDEWALIKKIWTSVFGKDSPDKLKWIGNLIRKFVEWALKWLKEIKKLTKDMWQGFLKFLGYEIDDVNVTTLPSEVKEYMHACSEGR